MPPKLVKRHFFVEKELSAVALWVLKAIYVPLGAPKIGHRRRTTKFTAREFKFGIVLPEGPQTPTSMGKSFLTLGRNQELPPRLLGGRSGNTKEKYH